MPESEREPDRRESLSGSGRFQLAMLAGIGVTSLIVWLVFR